MDPAHTYSADGGVEIPEEPYAEGTPLTQLFPDDDRSNVIAALLSEPEDTFSEDQLVRISGIPEAGEYADDIAETTDIVNSSEEGYKINTESDAAADLGRLEDNLLAQF